MRLRSQVIPILIDNYGITLVQWKMDVDTTKVKLILQKIIRYAKNKREYKLLVILAPAFQLV